MGGGVECAGEVVVYDDDLTSALHSAAHIVVLP
jgi:hypothetical protein